MRRSIPCGRVGRLGAFVAPTGVNFGPGGQFQPFRRGFSGGLLKVLIYHVNPAAAGMAAEVF